MLRKPCFYISGVYIFRFVDLLMWFVCCWLGCYIPLTAFCHSLWNVLPVGFAFFHLSKQTLLGSLIPLSKLDCLLCYWLGLLIFIFVSLYYRLWQWTRAQCADCFAQWVKRCDLRWWIIKETVRDVYDSVLLINSYTKPQSSLCDWCIFSKNCQNKVKCVYSLNLMLVWALSVHLQW